MTMPVTAEELVNCFCFFEKPIYRNLSGTDYFFTFVKSVLDFDMVGYF